MDIAGTISKYRKAKNLTQEALGELVGVTNQAVSKWENGTSSPDISIIPTLANALGILLAFEINSTCDGEYCAEFGYFPDLFALFQSARLAVGPHMWHCLRDTTVISDRSLSEDF